MSDELLFMRQTQPSRRSSAGDNQRLGVDFTDRPQKSERKGHLLDPPLVKLAIRYRLQSFSLLAHIFDELRTQYAFRKSGKILHQSGQRELSAGLVAFDDQRLSLARAA